MLPSAVVTVLNDAIARAQAYLLSHQAPEGHWVGELEANTTITSEYLLLCHLIDRVDRPKEAKAVRYLRRAQLSDGGWSLFEGGPANLSATIKGYFAMRMAGVSVDDPALAAARERIREMGGPVRADVFTKILLALFGEYDWNGVPAMPVEIMLLPRPFFLFNIYEVSYWSRTVIVPLLIIMDRKPVKWLPPHLALDELWPEPREKTSLRFPRVPKPFSWRTLFWKNFFIAVDDGLKIWERFTTRPLRKRAVEAARVWLEERLAVPGGLGGIYPAMANSILAMRLLGYPDDHPLVLGQLKEIEALGVETDDALHYQPCPSPVWDTGLAINALIESGLPPDHGALLDPSTEDLTGRGLELLGTLGYRSDFEPAQRALHFLRHTQRHDGPWYGRWGVNYIYGTWSVLRGLRAIGEDLRHEYVQRAVRWLERHQNRDGGWGETCESYTDPEFAGVGESTPSQTAWALLGLFAAGRTSGRAVERGIEYLRRTQRSDGAWEDWLWNGTGFPRVFYLKYHLYAKYFPLWALGIYRRAQA